MQEKVNIAEMPKDARIGLFGDEAIGAASNILDMPIAKKLQEYTELLVDIFDMRGEVGIGEENSL